MMAKAHVTVGMAAAFTTVMPGTINEALPVIAGASLGCLICDLDCENSRERTESSHWRAVMFLIAAAALLEDHLLDAGMWRHIAESGNYYWFVGIAGFVLTCTFASISSHRGFSHSILALVLETGFLYMAFPMTALPFAVSFASHQILDITNKKSVRLFYPLKRGVSLGWFYADKLANKIVAITGSVWLAASVIASLR
ncbi:MAG: metal-dependent hydrolase [Mogibacterium sp.]|nr:metal-dependent hydrolase [Mogibacterium sp.]